MTGALALGKAVTARVANFRVLFLVFLLLTGTAIRRAVTARVAFRVNGPTPSKDFLRSATRK